MGHENEQTIVAFLAEVRARAERVAHLVDSYRPEEWTDDGLYEGEAVESGWSSARDGTC